MSRVGDALFPQSYPQVLWIRIGLPEGTAHLAVKSKGKVIGEA